jgi:drug/metabolite transporter (DMT)-like permease
VAAFPLSRLISPFFVITWSTGFIVARYGLPYAEPATFLLLRFIGVLLFMLPAVLLAKVPWPAPRTCMHLAVAGVLLQAGYLGGVWAAIKLGMGAGPAALIVGMQPLLTAIAGQWLGDRPSMRQWGGLALGFVGVSLVVWNRLGNELTGPSLAWALFALLSITAGTLYQRRYCPVFDLRVGSVLQFGAAFLATLPFAFLFETRTVIWSAPFVASLAWSVLALSIGSISLLFLLIRRGAASKVASLMYLTPATTALMAWLLFGEPLTPLMILGMAVSAVGVAWAQGKR